MQLNEYGRGVLAGLMMGFTDNYLPKIGKDLEKKLKQVDMDKLRAEISDKKPDWHEFDIKIFPHLVLHHETKLPIEMEQSEKVLKLKNVKLPCVEDCAGKARDFSSALTVFEHDEKLFLCVHEWCTPTITYGNNIHGQCEEHLKISKEGFSKDEFFATIVRAFMEMFDDHLKRIGREDHFRQITSFSELFAFVK